MKNIICMYSWIDVTVYMHCHGLTNYKEIIITEMINQLVQLRKSKGNYITTRNGEFIM